VETAVIPEPPKASTEYVVLRFTDGWKVVCGARRWGRYAFQVDAVEAALRLARAALAKGLDARVTVQDLWGRLTPLEVAPA
jgi:hypothetical protein